jgi:hypothetical protein
VSDNTGTVVINGTITKWLLGVVGSAIALLMATLVAANVEYSDRLQKLERFQSATEANRFTPADAIILRRDIIDYHDRNTPPAEVLIQLQTLDERIDRLERP